MEIERMEMYGSGVWGTNEQTAQHPIRDITHKLFIIIILLYKKVLDQLVGEKGRRYARRNFHCSSVVSIEYVSMVIDSRKLGQIPR